MLNTAPDKNAVLNMSSGSNKGIVHVAVGVILDGHHQVLLAKRPDNTHQGGLWEFPGGKVDAGESVAEALDRELREELAIGVEAAEPLIEIRHDYGDKCVLLDVWVVTDFSGNPRGNEGQPIEWAALERLGDYTFPAANIEIIGAAQAWVKDKIPA